VEDPSAKALKSGLVSIFEGGQFILDAADDGLHSEGTIIVRDGSFTIASGG